MTRFVFRARTVTGALLAIVVCPPATAFAQEARGAGVHVIVNATDRSLSDQIREAARRGIPYFVAYGETEATSGTVRMKNLESGFEQEITIDTIADAIRSGS